MKKTNKMNKVITIAMAAIMALSSVCAFADEEQRTPAEKGTPLEAGKNGNVTVEQVIDAIKASSVLHNANCDKYLSAVFPETNEKFGDLVDPELTAVYDVSYMAVYDYTGGSCVLISGVSLKDPQYEYRLEDHNGKIDIYKNNMSDIMKNAIGKYYFDYDALAKLINSYDLGIPKEFKFMTLGIKITTDRGSYLYAIFDRTECYGKKFGKDYYNFKAGNCYNFSDYETYLKELEENREMWLSSKSHKAQAVDESGDFITIDRTPKTTDTPEATEKPESTKKPKSTAKPTKEPSSSPTVTKAPQPTQATSPAPQATEKPKIDVTSDKENIDIKVNEKNVSFTDAKPFVDANDRTQIPIRAVAEMLGAKVSWDNANYEATIEKDGTKVVIPIGKKEITKNGETISMDTEAIIVNERTYIPARFIAEALGYDVSYGKQ